MFANPTLFKIYSGASIFLYIKIVAQVETESLQCGNSGVLPIVMRDNDKQHWQTV